MQGGRYASDQQALKSTICPERRQGQVMAGPENAPKVPTTCLHYTLAILDPAACRGGAQNVTGSQGPWCRPNSRCKASSKLAQSKE
eukprot:4427496-Lingulodinium_polyedra.AAC.1